MLIYVLPLRIYFIESVLFLFYYTFNSTIAKITFFHPQSGTLILHTTYLLRSLNWPNIFGFFVFPNYKHTLFNVFFFYFNKLLIQQFAIYFFLTTNWHFDYLQCLQNCFNFARSTDKVLIVTTYYFFFFSFYYVLFQSSYFRLMRNLERGRNCNPG